MKKITLSTAMIPRKTDAPFEVNILNYNEDFDTKLNGSNDVDLIANDLIFKHLVNAWSDITEENNFNWEWNKRGFVELHLINGPTLNNFKLSGYHTTYENLSYEFTKTTLRLIALNLTTWDLHALIQDANPVAARALNVKGRELAQIFYELRDEAMNKMTPEDASILYNILD